MTDPAENLRRAREYLAAIEAGARGDALRAFYALDVVQVEFPNRSPRREPHGASKTFLPLPNEGAKSSAHSVSRR
jgi:hypothetical protein